VGNSDPQLWATAIRKARDKGREYHEIVELLWKPNAFIELERGRVMSKRQLQLEAIRHEPWDGEHYYALGSGLSPRETVVLHDGRTFTQRQLFMEAATLEPGSLRFACALATAS
jgi:hypothetical protein